MKSHLDYLKETLVKRFGEADGLGRYSAALLDLKIERFIKDSERDQWAARFFGRPQHLVGLVCKNYVKEKHVIQPFKIPPDWPVTAMIDLHPSKPMAIGFYATEPRHMNYVCDEVYENMPPEQVADEIIRRKQANQWRLTEAYIDPLAKGDEKFAKNRLGDVDDAFTIIENRLLPYGITLQTASKDRDSGVIAINTGLKSQNNMPSLFFFNTCTRHLWEIQRWVRIDGSAKDPDKHMMENLYRFKILKVRYVAPNNIHGQQRHHDPGVV